MALLFELKQKLVQGFQAFYSRYPRKEARKDAIKAWGQIVNDDPQIEAQIHSALDWQIPHWNSLEWYTPPLPASYLRGERFTDQPPTKKTTTPSRPTAPVLKLNTDPWDQQARMTEAQRLMREEKLTREEAINRAFK